MVEVAQSVLLVRHAVACSRRGWEGDDVNRPLTERGEQQARALIAQLADWPVRRILSSRAKRCIDTVVPLAAARGLEVEQRRWLYEGAGATALDVLLEMDTTVIACTHGDVIGTILDELHDRDWELPDDRGLAKASTWLLGHRAATYLRPPG